MRNIQLQELWSKLWADQVDMKQHGEKMVLMVPMKKEFAKPEIWLMLKLVLIMDSQH